MNDAATNSRVSFSMPSTKTVGIIVFGMIVLVSIAVVAGVDLNLKLWGAEANVGKSNNAQTNKANTSSGAVTPKTADDKELLEKMRGLVGPFKKENHSFRDITKIETIDEISKLQEDHPVRSKIISECANGSGPCATSLRDGYVSWPSNQGNFSNVKAYVCVGSKLHGKHLLIADRTGNRAIVLPAIGNAGATKGACGKEIDSNGQKIDKDNFIQLSTKHLECLNSSQAAPMTYNLVQIKQVNPNDYSEKCIEDLF